MAEETKMQGAGEVEEGKIFAVIGYIGILCLLPLLLKKDNKFALFHGKQGLVLFIAGVVSWVIAIIPVIGWIAGGLASIVVVIFSLIGLIQALMGNYWRIPIVADIADKIKF